MRRGRRVRSGTVCETDPRMSTLTVSANINYSLLILPDVTLIDFTNTSLRGLATASFASGDDVIAGRMGADKLLGGEGDDQFVYNGVLDGSVDEIIDGGGGLSDRIIVNGFSSPAGLASATISGVEILTLGGGATR